MNGIPTVSVIIPLYNKAPYIQRAIDSVLFQTFQDFEILIIDGGSTDGGLDVLKRYSDERRIRLIHQKDKGVSSARNLGIINSHSEMIAFLDADDEWLPIHLDTIISLREKYPHAGAYVTSYRFVESNGVTIEPKYKEIPPAPWEGIIQNYFRSALGDAPIWTSVVCVPREILLEVGCFNPEAEFGEDLDLWGKIALKYPIAFSTKLGAIYHRECENRICKKQNKILNHPFSNSVRKALGKNEIPEELKDDLKKCTAMYEIASAIHDISAGFKDQGRKILKDNTMNSFWFEKKVLVALSYLPPKIFRKVISFKTGKSE